MAYAVQDDMRQFVSYGGDNLLEPVLIEERFPYENCGGRLLKFSGPNGALDSAFPPRQAHRLDRRYSRDLGGFYVEAHAFPDKFYHARVVLFVVHAITGF